MSRVGFGGYRVDDQTPEHREALKKALVSGANLIDTSTNYTDGGSERLVGAVLNDLVGSEKLRREEIIVVSKIGYVQGRNLSLAQEREAAGRPFPEMVKYMEGCWHCLHPEFLQDQLDRSLARLGLQTLDARAVVGNVGEDFQVWLAQGDRDLPARVLEEQLHAGDGEVGEGAGTLAAGDIVGGIGPSTRARPRSSSRRRRTRARGACGRTGRAGSGSASGTPAT